MAVSEIINGLNSILAASTDAKLNAQLVEFQKGLIPLLSDLASKQAEVAALRISENELKAEIVRLKNWEAEKPQYRLVAFSTGMFARIHESNAEPLQMAHKLCATCFDNGKKSLLQMQSGLERKRGLFCPSCKTTLWLYHNAFSDESRG